jgi:hypothetical protein
MDLCVRLLQLGGRGQAEHAWLWYVEDECGTVLARGCERYMIDAKRQARAALQLARLQGKE